MSDSGDDDDFEDDAYAALRRKAKAARQANGAPATPAASEEEEEEEEEEEPSAAEDGAEDGGGPSAAQWAASPRRRSKGAAAPPPREKKHVKHDKGWVLLKDGVRVPLTTLDAYIARVGREKAPGRGFTGESWRPQKKTSTTVRNFRCLFKGCNGCLRAIRDLDTDLVDVYESTADGATHNSHIEGSSCTSGVPGELRALLTPNKLAMEPKAIRRYLRGENLRRTLTNGTLVCSLIDGPSAEARKMRKALTGLHKRFLEAQRNKVMPEGAGGRFGGLSSVLECLEREYLIAHGTFNEHSVHVLGTPLVVPETRRVTFSVSTENLLLNAYRQTQYGLPPFICVDTTHRLMIEGFCCMLIGTMSITQHFHTIAYAVCSHEDADAHEYVFRQVFAAIDAVVADRASKQLRV